MKELAKQVKWNLLERDLLRIDGRTIKVFFYI